MLCPKCGYYSERDDNICPECGTILEHESVRNLKGVQAIRQGKRAREEAVKNAARAAREASSRRGRTGAPRTGSQMPFVKDTRGDAEPEDETFRDDGTEETEEAGTFERRRRTF